MNWQKDTAQASAYSANCWTTAAEAGHKSGRRKLIYLSKTSKHPCSSSEPDKSHIHKGSCRETGLAGTVYTYISGSDGCGGSTVSYIQHWQWEIFPVPGLSWGTASSIHSMALDVIVADLLQHVLQQHWQLCTGNAIFAETMPDYVGNKDNAEQGGCLKHFLFFNHFSLPHGRSTHQVSCLLIISYTSQSVVLTLFNPWHGLAGPRRAHTKQPGSRESMKWLPTVKQGLWARRKKLVWKRRSWLGSCHTSQNEKQNAAKENRYIQTHTHICVDFFLTDRSELSSLGLGYDRWETQPCKMTHQNSDSVR